MQRQSLGGSPSSKLHINNNGVSKEDKKKLDEDEIRVTPVADEVEESKLAKLHNKSSFRIEKSIHLIPILTIFCFLILYLCSHDPSQTDLMGFSGFRRSKNKLDATGINDLERFPEIKTASILAIRSLRSLQEVDKTRKLSKKYRKLGDF